MDRRQCSRKIFKVRITAALQLKAVDSRRINDTRATQGIGVDAGAPRQQGHIIQVIIGNTTVSDDSSTPQRMRHFFAESRKFYVAQDDCRTELECARLPPRAAGVDALRRRS